MKVCDYNNSILFIYLLYACLMTDVLSNSFAFSITPN